MKKNIFVIPFGFIILFFLFVVPVHAQMGMMGNYANDDSSQSSQTAQQNQQKLDTIVRDLFKAQSVSSIKQLDCQKIGNDELEKLGDAWMDVRIPNESQHQAMDNMMGGEGSQSLTNAHIGMAEYYLGCSNGNTNTSWMPMLFGRYNNANGPTGFPSAPWSFGGRKGGGSPMMGYGYGNMGNGFGWGFGAIGFLFWLVIFIDLILLGVFLWKKIKK